jgi:hypothetical protein
LSKVVSEFEYTKTEALAKHFVDALGSTKEDGVGSTEMPTGGEVAQEATKSVDEYYSPHPVGEGGVETSHPEPQSIP